MDRGLRLRHSIGMAILGAGVMAGVACAAPVVISEIMYAPPGGGDYEFIELHNPGTNPVALDGASFTEGISFIFPAGTMLHPGGYVVVARNPSAFAVRYPGVTNRLPSAYGGALKDEGERVTLVDASSQELFSVAYDDKAPWPQWAAGEGCSLVLLDADGDPDEPGTWGASDAWCGRPGEPDTASAREVIVNEVLSHTDPPQEDAIELYNRSSSAVNLDGWYLSDDSGIRAKYRITNTVIAAHGYVVFYEYQFNTNALFDTNNTPFALDAVLGDEVYLTAADAGAQLTRVVDIVEFGPAENGVPFGAYPDGTPGVMTALSSVTLGVEDPPDLDSFRLGAGASNAYPRVGPLVINEIMYHPPDAGEPPVNNVADEFVELHNIGDDAVSLFDPLQPANTWRLSGEVDFAFPPATVVTGGGFLVVVGTTNVAAFKAARGLGDDVPVLGPWTGVLDNAGGRLVLEKPDVPSEGAVSYIVVDAVDYDDEGAWPLSPDGFGPSLERTLPDHYGNDASNWHAGVDGGTPGASNAVPVRYPPVAAVSAAASIFETQSVWLDGSESADPEGGALTYVWRQVDGPEGVFSSTNQSAAEYTAAAVASDAVVRLELVVTDEDFSSATAVVEVLVVHVGRLEGGRLAADASWSAADSPVGLWTNLFVPRGVRLEIGAGVRVLLATGCSVVAEGVIAAEGSAVSPVEFTCSESNATWGTLGFQNGATGVLRYCELRRGSSAQMGDQEGRAAICAYDSDLAVQHSLAEDMEDVVFFARGCNLLFQSNVVRRSGEGINAVSCRGMIADSVFSEIRNGGDGIDVDFDPIPVAGDGAPLMSVLRNVVHTSAGDGIDLGMASPLVDGNLVFHCADKGFSLGEGSSPDMMNNFVWGCSLALAIKDGADPVLQNHTMVENDTGISSYQKTPGMGGGRGDICGLLLWTNVEPVRLDAWSLTSVHRSFVDDVDVWPGSDNTNVNPGFKSPSNLNYRLSSTSLAADVLPLAVAPDHDMVGAPRPLGVAADAGALERGIAGTDYDRDGVPDVSDAFASDSRYSVDADQDGLPDEWELEFFASLARSGRGDFDGDGVRNRDEFVRGGDPASTGNRDVIISEVHFNPSDDLPGEFVEILNRGSNAVALSGWSLTDAVLFHFPTGAVIPAGAHLVIARDADELEGRVDADRLLGEYEGDLPNEAAVVRLTDARLSRIDEAAYDVLAPWPSAADGQGFSLERANLAGVSSDVSTWRASLVEGGTPGRSNSVIEGSIVINEVLAQPSVSGNDWLELFNASTQAVDISGWSLSDDLAALAKYVLPAGSVMDPGACLQVGQSALGFGLSAEGETLYLTRSDGLTLCSQLSFSSQQVDVSWGRYPNGGAAGYFCAAPSAGATNPPPPIEQGVVINEIMFNPPGDDEEPTEYVELYNPGAADVDLSGWRFADGIVYVFPTGTVLTANGYLVVARDPGAVETNYGLGAVLGPPDSGRLDNSGERLALCDALGNLVDEVVYRDRLPWPEESDGDGSSLELVSPFADNDLPHAWLASNGPGTPGAQNSVYASSLPPLMAAVSHTPTLPAPGQAVTVLASVRATDEPLAAVELHWRLDAGDAWNTVAMDQGSDGLYRATLAGFAEADLVLYYVTASDTAGGASSSPRGAPWVTMPDTSNQTTRTYLCLVTAAAAPTNLPVWRLLTSTTNWSELGSRDPESDEELDGALLIGNRLMQNIGYRYRGQIRGGYSVSDRYNLRLDLGRQQVHGDSELDLSNYTADREYLGSLAFHRAGVPCYEVRPLRLLINAVDRGLHVDMEIPDGDFAQRYYPLNAGDDTLMKGWYEAVVGEPSGVVRDTLLSSSGPGYGGEVEDVVDLEQWINWFATTIVICNWDTLLRAESPANIMLYHHPVRDRWEIWPLDLDSAFPNWFEVPIHDTNQEALVQHFITWPAYRRTLYERVAGLLDGEFAPGPMTAWLGAQYAWLGTNLADNLLEFPSNRAAYLETYLQEQIAPAFAPQLDGGEIWTWQHEVSLAGTVCTATIPAMTGGSTFVSVTYPSVSPTSWVATASGLTNGPNTVVVAALPLTNRAYAAPVTAMVHVLAGDYDGDGVSDADEAGFDSDSDGVWDYVQLDSDGDGYGDVEEAGDDNPATPPADTDGDGVPDCRDDDSDGDAFPDLSERVARTDRLDAASFLAVESFEWTDDGLRVTWQASTAVVYSIERSIDGVWSVLATNMGVSEAGTNLWDDPELPGAAESIRLYRLRAE